MKPSRRRAFQIIAGAMAGLTVRKQAAASASGAPSEAVADAGSMEVIGRTYLAEYGAPGIVAAVEQDAALGNLLVGENRQMLLRHKISQDFSDGNTVLVGGWMLSCTEAHACALAALRAAAPGGDQ